LSRDKKRDAGRSLAAAIRSNSVSGEGDLKSRALILFAAFFTVANTVEPASAGGIHIHVSLSHPLTPVQIDVGPVHANPSIMPIVPPSVSVDGNGTVAKLINKTNGIVQAPLVAATNIITNVVTFPIRKYDALRDSFNSKVAQVQQSVSNYIKWLGAEIPTVLVWCAAGIFLFITLAVLVGETISRLAVDALNRPRRRA
jgi:hypothetical protein